MKRQLFALTILLAVLSGCSSIKAPISASLYAPFVTDQKPLFRNAIGLRIEMPQESKVFDKHSSGFVGSAVNFQFNLETAVTGMTRDALSDVFNDIVFVRTADADTSRERLKGVMTVTYSNVAVKFQLSYGSNKFDRASFSSVARVDFRTATGENLYERTLNLKGDYVHESVGGDAGSLERAVSMAISRMVTDLKTDVAFAALFDSEEVVAEGSVEEKLEKLRKLREKGAISQEEYEKARAKVLSDMVDRP